MLNKVLYSYLIFVAIGCANGQGILDSATNLFTCATTLPKAWRDCYSQLDERLGQIDQVDKNGGQIDKSWFNCCYFADFSHCLDVKTEKKCGPEISKFIANSASSVVKTLNSDCSNYERNTPNCLFVIYLNVIFVFVLVFIALSVLCCVVKCLCR